MSFKSKIKILNKICFLCHRHHCLHRCHCCHPHPHPPYTVKIRFLLFTRERLDDLDIPQGVQAMAQTDKKKTDKRTNRHCNL